MTTTNELDGRLRDLEAQHLAQTAVLQRIEESLKTLTAAIQKESDERRAADALAIENAWRLKLKVYVVAAAVAAGSSGTVAMLAKLF